MWMVTAARHEWRELQSRSAAGAKVWAGCWGRRRKAVGLDQEWGGCWAQNEWPGGRQGHRLCRILCELGFHPNKNQEATEEFYVGDEMTWLVFAAEDASEGGSESRDRLGSFWAHHGRQGGKETDRMMGWASHVTFATSLNKVRYKEADETEKDGIHPLSFSLS